MFNLGGGEILVILLLALIVLGPQRLPEAARKLGNAIGEVRRMATGFQTEIKAALDEVDLNPASTSTNSRERPAARPKPRPVGQRRRPRKSAAADGPAARDDGPEVTGAEPDDADRNARLSGLPSRGPARARKPPRSEPTTPGHARCRGAGPRRCGGLGARPGGSARPRGG